MKKLLTTSTLIYYTTERKTNSETKKTDSYMYFYFHS